MDLTQQEKAPVHDRNTRNNSSSGRRKKSSQNHSRPDAASDITTRAQSVRTNAATDVTSPNSAATPSQQTHDGVPPTSARVKASGVRRIWGTLRNCTTTAVKNVIDRFTDFGEQIEVRRKYRSEGSRKRWWFLLKASEEVLELLESKWDPVQIQTSWKLEQCKKPVESPEPPSTSSFLDQAQ